MTNYLPRAPPCDLPHYRALFTGLAIGGHRETGRVILRPLRAAGVPGKTTELRRLTKVGGRPLQEGDSGLTQTAPRDTEHGLPLLRIKRHYHALAGLITNNETMQSTEAIISENLAAKIRSHGLRPTNRILLCGPL